MKTYLQLFLALGMIVTTAGAAVLFEEDFSGSLKPGTSYGTRSPSSDSAFASTWGMTSMLEQEAGNQYARFDFTITAQPAATRLGVRRRLALSDYNLLVIPYREGTIDAHEPALESCTA